jgi:hypothetical protein
MVLRLIVALLATHSFIATEVSVADFGARPNSSEDACSFFNKTIEAVRHQNATVLRIPTGTYHFYWNTCVRALIYVSNTVVTPLPPKPIGMWLRELENVVVEGEGSLLLFHGLMTPIVVDHSSNITVRNLSVDFPHPSVVEAQVAAATATTLDLKVHYSSNFTVANGSIVFGSGEGWSLDGVHGMSPANQSSHGASTLCQEFDPVHDTTKRRSNPLSGGVVTQLKDPSTVRVTYESKQSNPPIVGHSLWWRDGGRPNAGLLTQYSHAISYENVHFHFMSGFGVVAQYTKGISFYNFTIEPTAESGRGCACAADLLHFSGCAGLINVTNGRFVGSQDDGVNVHATHLQIVSQPAPNKIVVQFMHPESYGFQAFFHGDRVQFTRSDTLESFGTGVIETATMVSIKGCSADNDVLLPCQHLLELQDALVGARLKKDVIENLNYTADVYIGGAYFSRIPTRGILASTRGKVVIYKNMIHAPMREALHIADDAASWYESGPVADVLFQGNVIVRKGPPLGGDAPAVNLAPSNTKPGVVHRNVRIVGNDIHMHEGSKAAVVNAKSVAGLTLTSNRIFSPNRTVAPADMVQADNCSGVVVANNTVVANAAAL